MACEERNGRHNETHECGDGRVWVVVEARIGSVDVDGQLIHHIRRDVEEAERGDVAILFRGVVGLQRIHRHLVLADAETI